MSKTAKCTKCGGSANADTFEKARQLINHAVGLSRGIKCGDSYDRVREVTLDRPTKDIPSPTPSDVDPKPKKSTASEKPKEKYTTSSL